MNGVFAGTRFERLIYCLRYNKFEKESLDEFCGKKHEELLSLLIEKINKSAGFIDHSLTIEDLQGLQDSGVDVLIKLSGGEKIGIQLKSPFDISQNDFSKSTKAQISDSSQYPDLDQYLILPCPCPSEKGSIEKVKAFQSYIEKSTNKRVHVLGPEYIAGFLFGDELPGEFDLMQEWEDLRSIKKEYTDYEEFIDNSIRVRYLLCKSVKEAKKLLIDGNREHFPLSGDHTTVQTPSFQTLKSDEFDLENRSTTTTKRINGNISDLDKEDYPVNQMSNKNRLEKQGGVSWYVDLIPDEDEPLIQEHLKNDKLIRYLLEQGEPIERLLKFYAKGEGCSGGEYVIVESRQIEVVILEVSAIERPVREPTLFLKHKGSTKPKLLSSLENENLKTENFKIPTEVLKPDECILIPLSISLKPFEVGEGEKVREKTEVVSSATISGKQHDETSIQHGGTEEKAIDPKNRIALVGRITEVTHLGFVSKNGYSEKVRIRSLDRSQLLYVNQWLAMGCCPYLLFHTESEGWFEYGTILDLCNSSVGTQIVETPSDWTGHIKIEEREPEITTITSIEVDTTDCRKSIRKGPIILSEGEQVTLFVEDYSEKSKIIFTGYFVENCLLKSYDLILP